MSIYQRNGIILGNAPSSGSTLLVNLLGRSPKIFQCGELSIFDKPDWLRSKKLMTWAEFEALQNRGYRRHLGCEMSHHLSNFQGFSNYIEPTEDSCSYVEHCERLMDKLSSIESQETWVEKTPSNIFSINELIKIRPNWKYVTIVRDPRSVLTSLAKRGYSPAIAAARWYLPNLLIHQLWRNNQVILIRYEDLVSEPQRILEHLCNFVNVDFSNEMIKQSNLNSEFIDTWSITPAEAPSKVGLWSASKTVPEGYLDALKAIRPTSKFERKQNLVGTKTAFELASTFGYIVPELETGFPHTARSSAYYKEYSRYLLAMGKRRYLPRAVPFYFQTPKNKPEQKK